MASFFGNSLRLECASCGEPLTVSIRQKDVERTADGYDVTLIASLTEVRAHIAAEHPESAPISDGDG